MCLNTEIVDFNGKKLCAYCGKEANHETGNYSSHGRQWDDFFNCDCEGAKVDRKHQEEQGALRYSQSVEISPYIRQGNKEIAKIKHQYAIEQLRIREAEIQREYERELRR